MKFSTCLVLLASHALFADPCNEMFFIEGDLLAWNAQEVGLVYAIQTNSNGIHPINQGAGAPAQYEYMDPTWNIGMRYGAGIQITDGIDLFSDYTYLTNKTKAESRVALFGLAPNVGSTPLVNPWVSLVTFPVNSLPLNFVQINAFWQFRLNLFNVELGRTFEVTPTLHLRPFAGARGGWTKIHFKTVSLQNADELAGGNNEELPITFTTDFHNQFWGAGIVAGIQPTWRFFRQLSLWGEMGGALLLGHFKFKGSERDSFVVDDVFNQIILFRQTVNSLMDENYRGFQPILDLALGLRFETMCDPFVFAIDAGWEQHFWFHHVLRNKPISFRESITRDGVNTQVFEKNSNTFYDLAFGGFVLKANLDY